MNKISGKFMTAYDADSDANGEVTEADATSDDSQNWYVLTIALILLFIFFTIMYYNLQEMDQ